jgi:hypothetical protein
MEETRNENRIVVRCLKVKTHLADIDVGRRIILNKEGVGL